MRTLSVDQSNHTNSAYKFSMLDMSVLEEKQMIVLRGLKNSSYNACTIVLVFDKKESMKFAISTLQASINSIDYHIYLNVSSLVNSILEILYCSRPE